MIDNASRDFLTSLLGKPYRAGGQGPDSFDCWGMVRYVYAELFNIALQDFSHLSPKDVKSCSAQFEAGAVSEDWVQLDEPEHGCIVAMSRSKVIHHVGLWVDIDGGTCIHALDGASVIAQKVQSLRNSNFSKILFYRYAKSP